MITLTYSVIANLFFGQVTDVSGFGGISGIPAPQPDRQRRRAPEPALLRRARRRARRLRAAALHRADAVRADAAGRARRPGAHGSLGYNVVAAPDDRVRLRRVHRRDRRRALRLVERPHRPGVDRPRRDDRRARDRRDRRPLPASRAPGSARSFFVIINNYSQQISFIGPRFHTLIGAIFLVIVLVSPGGLIGLWERVLDSAPGGDGAARRPTPVELGRPSPAC